MKVNRHNLLIVAIGLQMLIWGFLFYKFLVNSVLIRGFQDEVIYFSLYGLFAICSLVVQLRYTELIKLLAKKNNEENLLDSEIVTSEKNELKRPALILRVGNAVYGLLNIFLAIILVGISIYNVFDDFEPFTWQDFIFFLTSLLPCFVGPMILFNMTSTNYKYS